MLTDDDGPLFRCRLYVGVGICAIIANGIILIVVNSNKTLSQKMVLCSFLAAAHLVNGISFSVAGFGQQVLIGKGTFHNLVHPMDCMTTKPWVVLQIFAGELPVITNLLLNVEIAVAALQPGLYRRYWSHKWRFALGLTGWCWSMIGVGLAFGFSQRYNHEFVEESCKIYDASGEPFGILLLATMAACYLISCIIIYLVIKMTNKTKTVKSVEMRRQKFLLSLDILSLLLVTVPNTLMITIEWKNVQSADIYMGGIHLLYGISSLVDLPAFITFRPAFRRQLLKLFGFKQATIEIWVSKCRVSSTRVQPMTTPGTAKKL